jgi:hypothetical protein
MEAQVQSWDSPHGFVMDKVALGQVFLLELQFFPVNYYSTKAPFYHLSSRAGLIHPLAATIPSNSVSPQPMNKNKVESNACAFSYMTDFDYITLEIKSFVPW